MNSYELISLINKQITLLNYFSLPLQLCVLLHSQFYFFPPSFSHEVFHCEKMLSWQEPYLG